MKKLIPLALAATLTMATAAHAAKADVGTASCRMTDLNGNQISWVWARFGRLFSEALYQKNAAVTQSPNAAQPNWFASVKGGNLVMTYESDPRYTIVVNPNNRGGRLLKSGKVRAIGTCTFEAI